MAKKQTVDEMRKKAEEMLRKANEEEAKLHAELGKKTEDFLVGKIGIEELCKTGNRLGFRVSIDTNEIPPTEKDRLDPTLNQH